MVFVSSVCVCQDVNVFVVSICVHGYPVPEFAWDGVDGQAYIYYRHSVNEPEFYKEFEEEYDANPDHTFFLRKNKI